MSKKPRERSWSHHGAHGSERRRSRAKLLGITHGLCLSVGRKHNDKACLSSQVVEQIDQPELVLGTCHTALMSAVRMSHGIQRVKNNDCHGLDDPLELSDLMSFSLPLRTRFWHALAFLVALLVNVVQTGPRVLDSEIRRRSIVRTLAFGDESIRSIVIVILALVSHYRKSIISQYIRPVLAVSQGREK